MITTLFFIQLVAFQIWYSTSSQVRQGVARAYMTAVLNHKMAYRTLGIGLLLVATSLFIIRLGSMSGIFTSVVGLMGVGSLVIVLNPLRYLNEKSVATLYVFFLLLEFAI